MTYEERSTPGAAVVAQLTGICNSGDASCGLSVTTGWVATQRFVVMIYNATDGSNSEKILCSGVSGSTLNFITRGYDGTAALTHQAGESVKIVIDGVMMKEAHDGARLTLGAIVAKGDLLVGTAVKALGRLVAGANGLPLQADSGQATGLKYGTLAQAVTHDSPDTDVSNTSLHHTIGTGAFQASAGNHTHSSAVDTQVFTGNGTWTKPANAKVCRIQILAAGGGGGSGRKGAAGSSRGGGAGGSGGGFSEFYCLASDLGATVGVSVGAGGTGGAAVTASSTDGNAGGTGGNSGFGAFFQATGGLGGLGGQAANGGAGQAGGTGWTQPGSIGGVGGFNGGVNGTAGPGASGGGGGPGINAANAYGGAGAAGLVTNLPLTISGLPGVGAVGSPNTGPPSSATANSGGGGGGGSAGINGSQDSIAGGVGGSGYVRVDTWS